MIRIACLLPVALMLVDSGRPDIRVDAQEVDSAVAPGDFPDVNNTEKSEQKWWAAERSKASIRVPQGFRVTLAAHEPQVRQPIAMTTDHRGRLWVAENYTYSDRTDDFDLRLRDRVVIFEDVDGDGQFDKRKVFWDQGKRLTSVEVGMGGVWLLCAPQLLFIPDADGDDVPDGKPQVVLDGWNADAVRHNIVNGLRWGPDGWLYGRHGILATSFVGRPGSPQSQRSAMNCGIWRIHPATKAFEIVADGTTNPWGLDFDDHGQMFFINTVIGHLWHVVPGAHFKRMYGVDANPHVYELIDQCADHFHWDTREAWSDIRQGVTESTMRYGGGHAHSGMMIYLGDNWPQSYRNRVFTLNLHGRRINQDRLERRPGGYVARHGTDFLTTADPWFRGIELIYGPDGGVFIADWCDVGECHENDGVHRTSGRVYKVTYGKTRHTTGLNLQNQTNQQLVAWQTHRNDWFVRQSRQLLQHRAAVGRDMKSARGDLLKMYQTAEDVRHRLRALWCLHVIKGIDHQWLHEQLNDEEEHVRAWAVRLLVDQLPVPAATAPALASAARREKSPLVRLYLASALQRMTFESRIPLAAALLDYDVDAEDPMIPLMIWYGLEPTVTVFADQAVQMAKESKLPLIRRHIARRLTAGIDRHVVALNELIESMDRDRSNEYCLDILKGMHQATRGWRQAAAPPEWPTVARRLSNRNHDELRETLRDLSVVFGDGQALSELQAIAFSNQGDPTVRQQALRVLVDQRFQPVMKRLPNLVNDRVLGTEAIRGLAFVEEPEAPRLILSGYSRLTAESRLQAINTLSSRPGYAKALLKAVSEGKIARGEITAFHARQMRSFEDPSINHSLNQSWGAIRNSSKEKKQRIEELKAQLTDELLSEADRVQGRRIFQKTCAKCHRLFGEGGKIGPDLTGGNRTNLSYLLENIIDPSATMVNDFKVSVIRLRDGRIVTGVVLNQDARRLTVQTQEERTVILRKDVDRVRQDDLSLMPEGLLKPLRDQEIRDLIGFLRGSR